MKNTSKSFYSKAYNPYMQGGIILGASISIMLLSKLSNYMGIIASNPDFCWLTAAAFLLLYAVGNSLFCLSTSNINKYWLNSMLTFLLLAGLSAGAAWALSGLSINEVEGYKWIFVVLVFGYLVFLSIVGFMKRIVDYAEAEDWQAPKKKRRERE